MLIIIQGESLARGPKLWSIFIIFVYLFTAIGLLPGGSGYFTCKQNEKPALFANTGKQVHLKHARRHFERNLVKDVHHRSVASRNWLKS